MDGLALLVAVTHAKPAARIVEVDATSLVAGLMQEQEREWGHMVIRTRKPVTLDAEAQVYQLVMFQDASLPSG